MNAKRTDPKLVIYRLLLPSGPKMRWNVASRDRNLRHQVALQRLKHQLLELNRRSLWHELVLLLPYRRLKALIEMVNLD